MSRTDRRRAANRTNRRRTAGAVGTRRLPFVRRGPLNRSPPAGCGERSGDRGSATVWTAGGIVVVMTVTASLLWFAAAVVTRHRAESAADLAALAAASTALAGEQQACGQARWVAENMDVTLLSCRLSGWDALVEVAAVPPGVLSHLGSAAARARAGPVERPSSTVIHTR